MRIVTNGDFVFPLNAKTYMQEQFYLWSHNTGAPNLDQIIRFFVRLPNLLVFWLTGSNVLVSYFYIAFVGVMTFWSFYYFCQKFLLIRERYLCVIMSLFYAINPVFLGNYSKIGLVLAATMLPFILSFAKQFYLTRRFSYILLTIFAINVSFIHPFNIIVNVGTLLGYVTFLTIKDRAFAVSVIPKIIFGIMCFFLINAYVVASIASVGTISKSALSENVNNQSATSVSLVDVANTGNIFTAFTLSKNVFLDYNFYGPGYKTIYLVAAFAIYVILLGLIVHVGDKVTWERRTQFIVLLTVLLLLLILSTGTFLGINKILHMIISLPGGWAFRSPLKWQLYLPIALCALLLILYVQLPRKLKRSMGICTAIILVLLNGYILLDITGRLLIPKDISDLSSLSEQVPKDGRALLIRDDRCMEAFQKNGSLLNEIRAVYRSQSSQLKEAAPEDIETINVATFNQVLVCQSTPTLAKYGFIPTQTIHTNTVDMSLLTNQQDRKAAYASVPVRVSDGMQHLSGKYAFLRSRIDVPFDFIPDKESIDAPYHIIDAFDAVTTKDTRESKITKQVTIAPKTNGSTKFDTDSAQNVFYKFTPSKRNLSISAQPISGFQKIEKSSANLESFAGSLTIDYLDSSYNYQNLVQNASFEQGPWKEKVGDCFAYNDTPDITMSVNRDQKTEGKQSLELIATSHVACTDTREIAIETRSDYIIAFDYKTSADSHARYNITFDDPQNTSKTFTLTPSVNWNRIETVVTPPAGTKHMKLTVYGIPALFSATNTLYDNFAIIAIPRISGKYFIVQQPDVVTQSSVNITSKSVNPSKLGVSVKNASDQLYVTMNETYHKHWKLFMTDPKHSKMTPIAQSAIKHYRANNHENGWMIDVQKACHNQQLCVRSKNGMYNVELSAQFTPQTSLNYGLVISVLSVGVSCIYIIYEAAARFRNKSHYKGAKS